MTPPLLQRPLVALLLFLGCVAALKSDKNKGSGFTYPVKEGLTFYEKDSVNVSWTTKFKSASLLVFCWGGAKENELNMSKLRSRELDDVEHSTNTFLSQRRTGITCLETTDHTSSSSTTRRRRINVGSTSEITKRIHKTKALTVPGSHYQEQSEARRPLAWKGNRQRQWLNQPPGRRL